MKAPVVLFLYDNFEHVDHIFNAILKSDDGINRKVYVYIDGARGQFDRDLVRDVTAKVLEYSNKLSHINVCARVNNLGLKANILSGVSDVLSKHHTCIVLEDDVIPENKFFEYHDYFLKLLDGSNFFHINSFTFLKSSSNHASKFMECWGWSTWSDKWNKFVDFQDFEIERLKKAHTSNLIISVFEII